MSWESRWHPIRQEWVTITAHRNQRPWQGETSSGVNGLLAEGQTVSFDKDCYLCPGNSRISGEVNDDYTGIFIFDNDHASFSEHAPEPSAAPGIYKSRAARGTTRVMCYHPGHNLSLAEMADEALVDVLTAWQKQTLLLRSDPKIASVLIFENKGEVVGVSNPHPHCQIYAAPWVFSSLEQENAAMAEWLLERDAGLLEQIIETECASTQRLINESADVVSFVPWFARWPFETWICPKRRVSWIDQLDVGEVRSLAVGLGDVLRRYDQLWQQSFPYILMLHQAPCDGRDVDSFHFHIEIYPPLRQPGLRKFLAGVETGGGNFLNDRAPEEVARLMRSVSP